jgi:hypothetical protein
MEFEVIHNDVTSKKVAIIVAAVSIHAAEEETEGHFLDLNEAYL